MRFSVSLALALLHSVHVVSGLYTKNKGGGRMDRGRSPARQLLSWTIFPHPILRTTKEMQEKLRKAGLTPLCNPHFPPGMVLAVGQLPASAWPWPLLSIPDSGNKIAWKQGGNTGVCGWENSSKFCLQSSARFCLFLFYFASWSPVGVLSSATLCLEQRAGHIAPASGLASLPHISACDEDHKESNDFSVNKRRKKNDCMSLLWQTTSTDTHPTPLNCVKHKYLKKWSTHRCSSIKAVTGKIWRNSFLPLLPQPCTHLQVTTGLQQRGVFIGRGPSGPRVGPYPLNKCQTQQSSKEETLKEICPATGLKQQKLEQA